MTKKSIFVTRDVTETYARSPSHKQRFTHRQRCYLQFQCRLQIHIKNQMHFFICIYLVPNIQMLLSSELKPIGKDSLCFQTNLLSASQLTSPGSSSSLFTVSAHPSSPAKRGPSHPGRTFFTLIQMCQTCLKTRVGIIRPQAGNATTHETRETNIRPLRNKIFKASKEEFKKKKKKNSN